MPKHISIGSIVIGMLGSIMLISYISFHTLSTGITNGKLIIRLLLIISFSIVFLMLYFDYYKKAVKEFNKKNNDNNTENILEGIEKKASNLFYVPPSPIELGIWMFFGLVVLGDVVNNI